MLLNLPKTSATSKLSVGDEIRVVCLNLASRAGATLQHPGSNTVVAVTASHVHVNVGKSITRFDKITGLKGNLALVPASYCAEAQAQFAAGTSAPIEGHPKLRHGQGKY